MIKPTTDYVVIKRPWWIVCLIAPPLYALLGAGVWWLWDWGWNLDSPSWAFYFAAFVGVLVGPDSFYLRRRR